MKILIYSLLLPLGPLMPADAAVASSSDRAVAEESVRIAMETKTADDLARTSSDLRKVKECYESAEEDLKQFRAAHPGYRPQDKDIELRDVEDRLLIVKWALEGSPNLNDGAALNSVTVHLHELFQAAEREQLFHRYEVANRVFEQCLRGWLELSEMYPKWHSDQVWQEIQTCSKKVPVPPPQHYRYEDKKLGTLLTV